MLHTTLELQLRLENEALQSIKERGRGGFLCKCITWSWAAGYMSTERQTKKAEACNRSPENPHPFPCSLSHSSQLRPPHQPSTDQHMWWRMTHLFFYKVCVYVKLLKCIKMSSTLGGPPRLPWKITRWKYNFSAGEAGVWTEFSLSHSLFIPSLTLFLFFFFLALPFLFYWKSIGFKYLTINFI